MIYRAFPAALFAVAALVCAAASEVRAQSSSSSGSSAFGSRSVGSGTLSSGNRSLGGSSGANRNSSLGLNNQANTGSISGNERFVRGSRQPGQFVGADSKDTTNVNSGLGNNQLANQLLNLGRIQQQNANLLGNRNQKNALRIETSLDLEAMPGPAPNQVSAQMAARMSKLPGLKLSGPLTVSLEGSKAILRGSVSTDRDRELASQLVLLEPGVSEVVNELVVQPAPLPPATAAPANSDPPPAPK